MVYRHGSTKSFSSQMAYRAIKIAFGANVSLRAFPYFPHGKRCVSHEMLFSPCVHIARMVFFCKNGGKVFLEVPSYGRVAEWLCRGLQILVCRFDSGSGLFYSSVAQLVEQVTVNHFVGGSSPSRGAIRRARVSRTLNPRSYAGMGATPMRVACGSVWSMA